MSEGNTGPLLAAVQNGKAWIDRFTRKDYTRALEEYRERFGPAYREAALAAGENGVPALAEALLDGLAKGWAEQRPWNRSMVRMIDKQMIVFYLSPVLLEDPVCAPLAEALQKVWASRWPKEAYRIAGAEKIQKGFRPTIFGIPLPVGGSDGDE